MNNQAFWRSSKGTVSLLAIWACIIGLCWLVYTIVYVREEQTTGEIRSLYGVWCKIHNRTNITFQEWEVLRRNGVLTYEPKN